MLLAQISDLHVSTPGSDADRRTRTAERAERAIDHLNRLTPRPDRVLVTGDLVERGHPDEYARLRALLDRLDVPYHVVPGNHDARRPLTAAFSDRCGGLRGDGFVQYVVDDLPVRLVGLDTLAPGRPDGLLCGERLAWLDARLAEAPDAPTLVFMHHPPFATGIAAIDAMGLTGADGLAAVIRRHPQVERIVAGHVHRAITARFAGTLASTCPSTAHQVALDLIPATRLAVVMEPPACALHLWRPGLGLVSHLSVIAHPTPPFVVFDGERWLADAEPPPGFDPPHA
jgi:3',5'-cyclic AMP phosphodiesterase CpdA